MYLYIYYTQESSNSLLEILDEDNDFNLDNKPGSSSIASKYSSLVQLYTYFLFMFQSLFRTFDSAMNILLKFLSMFWNSVMRKAKLQSGEFVMLPDSVYAARKL